MKKYLFRLLTLAVIVPALASCSGQLEDNLPLAKKHTVYFSTVVGGHATRTGLSIEGENVIPDWRGTIPADVHVFEMNGSDEALLGEADNIVPYDDNLGAHFKVDIEEEMTIIVTPPSISNPEPNSDGAKVLRQGSNTYGAVVAKSKKVNDEPVFYIPAVQTPDAETLKDPGAEFLVGYSRDSYDSATLEDGETVVDLYFDRVAALSRIGFTNFSGEGEKVISVKINSQSSMTGSVKASDISFGNSNSVSWTPDTGEGAGVLTLSYGEGADIPTDKPFYAYFVSMPDTFNITSIEVLTDQYHYTKTVGQSVEFDLTSLKNLNADLSKNTTAEEIASNVWYKASVLEAGYSYMIVSANNAMLTDGSTLSVVPVTIKDDGTIEIEPSEVTLWNAAEHIEYYDTGKPAGHFTLSIGSGNDVKYLQRYSNQATQNGDIGAIPSTGKYYVWDYDGEHLYQISRDDSNGTYYIYYDGSWKFEYQSSPKTYLYTTRAPQEPGFDPTGPFTFDIDQLDENPDANFSNEPELINYYGDVTYSSSDESIATVDASGDVTVLKAGTVEIIATVAGDATHQAATASYLINITTSKITTWYKADEMAAGDDYLIVSNGFALKNNDGSVAAVSVEVTDDVIMYNATTAEIWKASSDNELTNDGKYLQLSVSNNSTSLSIGSASSTPIYNQWNYDAETEHLYAKTSATSTTNQYIYYSTYSSTANFTLSTSGEPGSYSNHNTCLYTTSPQRLPRNLSFGTDPVTVTHDLANGTDVAEPTLTGDKIDDVTYAVTEGSSVASVNATSGEITLTGITGSAVITASALRTDTYKAGSISYTLIVKDSSLPTKRYVLASEIVAGKKYLIVSNGHALKNDNGVAAEGVTPAAGVIELESGAETSLEWTAAAHEGVMTSTTSSSAIVAGHFSFSNGSVYLKRNSKSGTFTVTFVENPTTIDKYLVWDLQDYNGVYYLFHDSSSSMRFWLSYNDGWNLPYLSNNSDRTNPTSNRVTNGPVNATQLYVEEGGDTPPTPEEQEQSLSFPEASYTAQMGTAFTAPVLSGVKTTVTYSSSATGVATVDASTGAVTLVAPGETTITANAPAGTVDGISYKAGSAQYTLTVSAAPSPENVSYVKVSSLVSGQTYLIVSHGDNLAFKGDGVITDSGIGASMSVAPSGGVISGSQSTFVEYEAIIKAESTGHYSIFFKNLVQYVALNNNANNGLKYVDSWQSGGDADFSLSTVESGDYAGSFLFAKSSRYLYHNDTQFKIGGSGKSKGVHLYMKYNGEQLAQNLSFNPPTVTIRQNETFTKPVLSGAMTTVSYSSDNANVAEVDSSTGDVTVKGVGTAHITASAVSGTVSGVNYGSGSAQYTLNVNEASSSRSYMLVSSVSVGTYLLVGRETNTNRKGIYVCKFPPTDDNKCDHIKVSDDMDQSTIESGDYVDYEVELIASDSNWLVKVKNTGKYMYFANNKINFTDDESLAKQSITTATVNGSTVAACLKNDNNDQFYHSGSGTCFMYSNGKNANNLRFFKLQ